MPSKQANKAKFAPFEFVSCDEWPAKAIAPTFEICELVNHVKDVVSGAALVFEMLADHDGDVDSAAQPYLSEFHLGLLQRLAIRSLNELDEKASVMAANLQSQTRGQS